MAALAGFVNQELQDDPQDIFFRWLAGHLPKMSPDTTLALGWIVLIYGLLKVLIAAGLWYRAEATRNISVAIFGFFGVYGAYQTILNFSLWKLMAVCIDLYVLYYFWVILPRHLVKDVTAGRRDIGIE